jgi:hypothetical protein
MDSKRINFRVAGLVKQGGFVWSGCPDAVCAAITALRGILEVAYDAWEDLFTVGFDSQQARLEDIFAAVYLAGRQTGQDYLPQLVPWRPPIKGLIKALLLMPLNFSAAAPLRYRSVMGFPMSADLEG